MTSFDLILNAIDTWVNMLNESIITISRKADDSCPPQNKKS